MLYIVVYTLRPHGKSPSHIRNNFFFKERVGSCIKCLFLLSNIFKRECLVWSVSACEVYMCTSMFAYSGFLKSQKTIWTQSAPDPKLERGMHRMI